jgi:hypothetical protein
MSVTRVANTAHRYVRTSARCIHRTVLDTAGRVRRARRVTLAQTLSISGGPDSRAVPPGAGPLHVCQCTGADACACALQPSSHALARSAATLARSRRWQHASGACSRHMHAPRRAHAHTRRAHRSPRSAATALAGARCGCLRAELHRLRMHAQRMPRKLCACAPARRAAELHHPR